MESDVMQNASQPAISEESITSLKKRLLLNLVECGFTILENKNLLVPQDKEFLRKVHNNAVKYQREKKKAFIDKFDQIAIDNYMISGNELDLNEIEPVLLKIDSKRDNDLFNWVRLHWSIPTSAGYGRRLRYVVYDKGNSAVIGIIGLADPVFALKDRDRYIGWTPEVQKRNLKHVMDAFVLGSIPPYSMVLGGKMVASLLHSPQISTDFREKYGGRKTRISEELFNGELAAVTTASALGKSSVYDRLKIPGTSGFLHVGWSKGSGEFQFFNGIYDELFEIAHKEARILKNSKWGSGVRNRRTVIRTGLKLLGLPANLLYHNIKRELFLVPLGEKSLEFLRGESKQVGYYGLSMEELSEFAIKRWLKPRASTRKEYLDFKKESYTLRSF